MQAKIGGDFIRMSIPQLQAKSRLAAGTHILLRLTLFSVRCSHQSLSCLISSSSTEFICFVTVNMGI